MEREEIEICPFCDSQVSIIHDTEKDGYEAECPKCRETIMLCDACQEAEDNKEKRCNWDSIGCFRKRKDS